MPQFADTVEYLAKHGPEEFYKGEIAKKIATDCEELGGYLTRDDFASYQVIERQPLRMSYRDYEICTNPPPSAGGSLAAFTLKLMEREHLATAGFGTARHLGLLANAMRLTSIARAARLDGGLNHPDIQNYFFDKAFLAELQAQLSGHAMKIGSTTHFTVADANMNIASATSSSGEGSGYAVPGTDIMLNNMLGEEDLNPGGFHQWPEDRRMTSMMAPTMLFKGGKPVLATGTGGANRIRSTIAQIISNLADFGMDVESNIDAPRIHWDGSHLDMEPGFNEGALEQLRMPEAFSHKVWPDKAFYFGGAHTVAIDEKGNLSASGDFRRTGSVQVVY
jgi:gamma-glutamyltranspeptidase/glutathione hydrolase